MDNVAAVVIAGGNARRLGALSQVLPKLLLPIGENSVIDHTANWVSAAGIETIHFLLGRHGELIDAYLRQSVSLTKFKFRTYMNTANMGTAGPLRVVDSDASCWLVINGDVISSADLKSLVDHHLAQKHDITIGTTTISIPISYGVLGVTDDGKVREIREKPVEERVISAGVYVVSETARALLSDFDSPRLEMTDFIQRCIDAGLEVRSSDLGQDWYDIGTPADYLRAYEGSTGTKL